MDNIVDQDPFFVECEERTFRLLVEDKILYVSKESMASYSPVFKKMLYSDFKENAENTVEFTGKKLDEILQLLHALFPFSDFRRHSINDKNFENLMALADEYDIKQVKNDGEKFLYNEIRVISVGDEDIFDIAIRACKFDLKFTIKECVPYLCVFTKEIFDKYKDRLSHIALSAIFEAKANRLLAGYHRFVEQDNFVPCSGWNCKSHEVEKICENCRKCIDCAVGDKDDPYCTSFHSGIQRGQLIQCRETNQSAYETQNCICGYEFDETVFE